MSKYWINIENASIAEISPAVRAEINNLLSFAASTWTQGPFKKRTRRGYVKRIIATIKINNQKVYIIPARLVDMAVSHLEAKKIKPVVTDASPKRKPLGKPVLKGITFRKDQITTLIRALTHSNGVIIEPTGTGKTVLAAGIMSSYKIDKGGPKTLFLAHTKDLIIQAKEEFERFGFKVGVWQGKVMTDGDVIVATRQTASKKSYEEMAQFGMLIVDETHHISAFQGEYYQLIHKCCNTVARYGFTATKPTTEEAKWALDSAIGPIISEKTIIEGNELGILAKPQINMIIYQGDEYSGIEKSYAQIYQQYCVKNKQRNRIICDIVSEEIAENRSCLIFISKLEHGERLQKMLENRKIGSIFVHGASDNEKRNTTKSKIQTKQDLVVICSVIWKEGVSIKSLNNVILASGGKDEKGVLQAVGRGTRLDKGKTEVTVWDFFDQYKYLSEHSIGRARLYKESGWDVELAMK
jgi:superfamily II DNA or RNA helicase